METTAVAFEEWEKKRAFIEPFLYGKGWAWVNVWNGVSVVSWSGSLRFRSRS